jgi:hypothetical protein
MLLTLTLALAAFGPAGAEEASEVTLVGQALYSSAFRVEGEGSRLYVGCGASVLIYDVSQPTAPQRLGAYRTEGEVSGLCARGDRLYVAAMLEGVLILDVSDPGNPTRLGVVENAAGGAAMSVFVRNDTAYVADGAGELLVADCSDPENPTVLGTWNPGAGMIMMDLRVLGDLVFAVRTSPVFPSRLTILDVSDPQDIRRLGNPVTGYWASYALDVAPDTTVFVANGFGIAWGGPYQLLVYDASDPEDPVRIGRYTHPNPRGTGCDVVVRDGAIYFAAGYLSDMERGGDTWYPNFLVFDRDAISDGMEPVGQLMTENFTLGLDVLGPYAYVADEWAGVQVVRVSVPTQPEIVARIDTGGYPFDVAVSGRRAYVPAKGGKLRIVDLTDPANPQELAPVHTPGPAWSVAAAGSRLYVGEGFDFVQGLPGLTILDIGGEEPQFLGRYQAEGDTTYYYDLAVRGDTVYVANGLGGLRILDATDPQAVELVSLSEVPGMVMGIHLADTLAYLAAREGGLRIWSVTDPANPVEVGAWTEVDTVWAVLERDGILYLACGYDGVATLDATDPVHPTLLDLHPTEGAYKLDVWHRWIYVADGTGGLRVLDATDPAALTDAGFYDTPSFATGVVAGRDTVYVTDQTAGLLVLHSERAASAVEPVPDEPAPPSAVGVSCWPNPFRAEATLRFGSVATVGSVEIFDVGGRRVRLLQASPVAGGVLEARWDGRDDSGRPVTPGVYFFSLRAGSEVVTGRLVRLE